MRGRPELFKVTDNLLPSKAGAKVSGSYVSSLASLKNDLSLSAFNSMLRNELALLNEVANRLIELTPLKDPTGWSRIDCLRVVNPSDGNCDVASSGENSEPLFNGIEM